MGVDPIDLLVYRQAGVDGHPDIAAPDTFRGLFDEGAVALFARFGGSGSGRGRRRRRLRFGHVRRITLTFWQARWRIWECCGESHWSDLNRRPLDYESRA